MTTCITRVAVPAHIYIAIETPDTYSDEQILAEAKARVAEVEEKREYLSVSGFKHSEHVLVYPDDRGEATIEDRE